MEKILFVLKIKTIEKVSIVIPCYNGENYIFPVYNSITNQSVQNIEMIFVDDGSKDKSKERILSINDPRIIYTYQPNSGVSSARNKGLKNVSGEYVVFFDVDDLMTDTFLKTRVDYLEVNTDIQFVCGEVQKFSSSGIDSTYYKGTSNQLIEEILLFDKVVVTCPSNYMFRKTFLEKNKLNFNSILSSTADKFFLIEAGLKGRCELLVGNSKLLYRVSEQSMSYKLTEGLLKDNEVFYDCTNELLMIRPEIQRKSLCLQAFFLSVSYYKIGKIRKAIKFSFISFFKNPAVFIKKLITITSN